MSLSNQARTRRDVELRTKDSQIAALYGELKSDEEIANVLHIDAALVRSSRDSMGLPPLRSASGRLFVPEDDFRMLQLRDGQGKPFREIAQILGHLEMDIEVRYRILCRLERKAESPKPATIPCMICHKPFVSADRKRIRFCLACRKNEVSHRDSPFCPDGGGYRLYIPTR